MPRLLIFLALLLLPLHAMDIVHGDRPLPPRLVQTKQALIIVSKAAAADGWMQMYVFHPAPEERAALLEAGQGLGTMGVLPAGSQLRLIAMARNKGALMVEIASVGEGDTAAPARGAEIHRQVSAADASYPFSIPPAAEQLVLQPGAVICCDSADARAASPDIEKAWHELTRSSP